MMKRAKGKERVRRRSKEKANGIVILPLATEIFQGFVLSNLSLTVVVRGSG